MHYRERPGDSSGFYTIKKIPIKLRKKNGKTLEDYQPQGLKKDDVIGKDLETVKVSRKMTALTQSSAKNLPSKHEF
jgi:hypothetical protein